MQKISLLLVVTVVGWVTLGYGKANAGEVSVKSRAGETPKEYTIEKGDTLWDLSEKFYHDPFQWPAIWGKNEYIENPDLIYPGQKLNFFIPGKKVGPKKKEVSQREEPSAEPAGIREKVPALPVETRKEPVPLKQYRLVPVEKNEHLFLSAGFIEEKDGQVGEIVSSFQQRMQFVKNDRVGVKFDNYSPRPGERLVVYSTLDGVRHPKTKEKLGNLVKILGHLKVSEKRAGMYTARITRAFDVMTLGDKVRKYEEPRMPLADPGRVPAVKDISGYIVALSDKKQYVGPNSLIYIDRGKADGVASGDLFEIYEETPALRTDGGVVEKDEKIPPLSDKIGEFRILTVRENTSTGWLIQSSREVGIGRVVRYAHRAEK